MGNVVVEDDEDFMIEERLPVRGDKGARQRGRAYGSRHFHFVGARPRVFQPSAFEKAFPHLTSAAPPTCEQAFEQALHKPSWHVDAEAEVSFIGKGFEGSWAAATVVLLEGRVRAGESSVALDQLLCNGEMQLPRTVPPNLLTGSRARALF